MEINVSWVELAVRGVLNVSWVVRSTCGPPVCVSNVCLSNSTKMTTNTETAINKWNHLCTTCHCESNARKAARWRSTVFHVSYCIFWVLMIMIYCEHQNLWKSSFCQRYSVTILNNFSKVFPSLMPLSRIVACCSASGWFPRYMHLVSKKI